MMTRPWRPSRALDGQDHDGRRLTVNEARPRTPGGAVVAVAAAVIAAAAVTAVVAAVTATTDGRPSVNRSSGLSASQSLLPLRPRVARRNSGFFVMHQSASDRSASPVGPAILARIEQVLDEQVRPGPAIRRRGHRARRHRRGSDRAGPADGRLPGMLLVADHDHDAGRIHLEGRRAGNPLRRGRPVIRPFNPGTAEPPWLWPRAAYVHIPFCAHKCGYCDFASLAGVDHLADRYLAALEREMAISLDGPQEVDTIFVGGGTPTRLDAAQLERLTGIIGRWFVLAPGGEWTVEANPGTLDAQKADILAEAGVDRISLGAQSFRPDSLRVLERHHGRAEVEQAVAIVGPRFPRWSLDLIFGVPGSSLDDWRARPGDRDGVRAVASLLLRAGLREGDRPLEATGAGRGAAAGRGARAVDVRDDHRSALGRPAWRCTRSPTSPGPATSRGITWSTGRTTPISASGSGPRATSAGCGRSTPASSPRTSVGSNRASRPPDPARS